MVMVLHRDPHLVPQISASQAKTRRKIWNTILKLDVQTSLDTGISPLNSLENPDTTPPSTKDND